MTNHKPRNRRIMAAAALAGIAILAYVFWPGSHPAAVVDPRTRVYVDYSACLFTGPAGTTGNPATAIWAGMQQASTQTSERIRTLPMTGPQNLATAEQSLNTLALQNCNLIITTGDLPNEAAEARATAFRHQHFLAVGGTGAQSNLSFLPDDSPSTLTAAIKNAVTTDYTAHASAH
jgi:basic membrane lipoprotein Med (substrate-binding protein (PBP1-ABC) superfamily)